MLLVETYLDYSEGKGLGLFAKHRIPKGEVYWIRNELFDKIITPCELSQLNELAIAYVKHYGCLEQNGNWYLCGDNARYSNHSNESHCVNVFTNEGLIFKLITGRSIESGQEILCDYRELCQTCNNGVDFLVRL